MNFFKKAFGGSGDAKSHDGASNGGRNPVMTKDELRQANVRLSGEVTQLQPKVERMTDLITKLQREYNLSKSHDPLSRYNVLKDLIKTFLEDWDKNQLSAQESSRGAVGLVQRAKMMAKAQENVADKKEKYRGLSHAELLDEHESLKTELSRLRAFDEKGPKAVETLKMEYESSKQFDAMRRYKILKDLIKEVVSVVDPAP